MLVPHHASPLQLQSAIHQHIEENKREKNFSSSFFSRLLSKAVVQDFCPIKQRDSVYKGLTRSCNNVNSWIGNVANIVTESLRSFSLISCSSDTGYTVHTPCDCGILPWRVIGGCIKSNYIQAAPPRPNLYWIPSLVTVVSRPANAHSQTRHNTVRTFAISFNYF